MFYLLTLTALVAAVFGGLWWRERLTIRRLRLQNHEHAMQGVELYGQARHLEQSNHALIDHCNGITAKLRRLDARAAGRAATIRRLLKGVERFRRERRHLARVAEWYAHHDPRQDRPEWCCVRWHEGLPLVWEDEMEATEALAAEREQEEETDGDV